MFFSIMSDVQLEKLVSAIENQNNNWDTLIAISTFFLGYLLNWLIGKGKSKKLKEKDLADNFWDLFNFLQYLYRRTFSLRILIVKSMDSPENRGVSDIMLNEINMMYPELWDKFHAFDRLISKKDRKKETFAEFHNEINGILEKMEKLDELTRSNESLRGLLDTIVCIEDKTKDIVEHWNKKATKMKNKVN